MLPKDGDLVLSVSSVNESRLVRVPKTGGAATTLRATTIQWEFAVDASQLYFFAPRSSAAGTLDFVRAPYADPSAPAASVVAMSFAPDGLAGVGAFALDASAVYFVGSVVRRDTATGLLAADARLMKIAK
jgi:hypothetical protein